MRHHYFFIYYTVLLLSLILPFHVQSGNIEALPVIPEDFQFHGKPISALCIAEIANNNENKSAKVNLLSCTQNEKNYKLDPYKEAIDNGFIGFDYSLKNSNDETVAPESAYYKYLGKFNNLHVIYLNYSGGGSGTFSSVFLVERKNDTIEYIKNIVAVGDRCNGGINNVSLTNNTLSYSLNITPYDYIDLSEIKIQKLKAYDDLSACAACCQGTAQFESDFEKSKFVSIDIGELSENTQGTYQECFNALLKDYKQQNKSVLSPMELKEFVEQFKTKCLK